MNMKMELASLRALLKTSRNTIAMLQEKLKQYEDISDDQPVSNGLVLGNDWKMSGKHKLVCTLCINMYTLTYSCDYSLCLLQLVEIKQTLDLVDLLFLVQSHLLQQQQIQVNVKDTKQRDERIAYTVLAADSSKSSSAQGTQSDEMTSTEGKIVIKSCYSRQLNTGIDLLDVTLEPSTTEPSKTFKALLVLD